MEGKKRYIAIILFLLICLMLFTFATTGDEELETGNGNGNDIQEVTNKGDSDKDEEKDSDSEKEESNNQNSSSTGSSNNGNSNAGDDEDLDGTGNTDNSAWDKALAAVEELEKVLTDDQLNIARELVEEITNSDQYKELIERVEDAEDAIDATALVEALEKMVEEAAKREDIEDASDFRDDEVLDAVNEIDGEYLEEVKEDLLDRIEKLNKILDDATAPKVEGIEDGDTTKKDVELTITDDNEVTTTVTKDGQTYEYVEKFTEEGTYELTVVDSAFNETKLTFTIDKTNPKFEGLKSREEHIDSYTVDITDATETTITVQKDHGKHEEVEEGYEITEEGTYQIIATDAAGNKASTWVIVDKTNPTITNEPAGDFVNSCTTITVFDRYLTNVSINNDKFTRKDFSKNTKNENFKLEKEVCEEGIYTITAKDKSGKEVTRTIEVDKTAAKLVSSDFYVHGLTQVGKVFYTQKGNKITVNVKVNEELGQVPTFTLHNNGKDYVLTDVLDRGENAPGVWLYQASYVIEDSMADGEVTFTISNIVDKAGNVTADVTAPTNGRRVIVDNTAPKAENLAILGGKGYWVGKEYKQYATTGTIVYVNVRMYEELATTPVVTLNDTVTLTKATKKESNGVWIYSYSYRLKENDGIADGVLQVKVTNIKDLASNSIELTNADCKKESQSEVIVDRKPITIEGINASEYIYDGVGVTPSTKDTDVQSVKLEKDGEVVEGYELGTSIINAGSYKLTVTDLAGNKTVVEFIINKKQLEFELNVDEVYEYAGNEIKATINVTNAESTDVYEIDDRYYIMNDKGQFMGPLTVDYAKDLGTYKVKVVIKSTSENYADSETKSLTFKVVDTTAPQISLNGESKITIEAGIENYEEKYATVTDNYDETITDLAVSYINYTDKDGNFIGKVTAVDNKKLGTYKVVYTHTDSNGNVGVDANRADHDYVIRLVTVVDTTAPQISLNGESKITLEAGKDNYKEKNATVTDNYDETITNLAPAYINYTDKDGKFVGKVTKVDNTKLGTYKVVYTHTDSNGNVGVDANRADHEYVIRVVTVQDTIKPTLTVKDESIGTDPIYSKISFKLSDSNQVDYIMVNGNKFDVSDAKWSDANYNNIKKYLVEGENTAVLYDTAGNSTSKTFTMDWTAPTITIKDDSIGTNPIYSKVNFKLYDDNKVDYVLINGNKFEVGNAKWSDANYGNIKNYLVEGENSIVLYDVAGNSKEMKATMDWTAPTITIKDDSIGTNPIYSRVNFKLYDDNKVDYVLINGNKFEVGNAKWSDANYGNIKNYLVEGENSIVLYDVAGNSKEMKVTMDWTAPTVETQYRTDLADKRTDVIGSDKHNIVFSIYKNNELVHTVDAKSNYKRFSIDWLGDGVYKVVVTDAAGLSSETTVTIDHTAPVVTPSYTELTVEGDKNATFNQFPTFEIDDLTSVTTTLVSGNVDMATVGEYILKYEFVDEFNNKTTKDIVVKVVDTTPAQIIIPYTAGLNKNEMIIEAGTKVTVEDVMAMVKDNIDADTTIAPYRADLLISNKASENIYDYDFSNGFKTNYLGRYNLYYKYIDAEGNESTAGMMIVMKDYKAPTVRFTKAGSSLAIDELDPVIVDGIYYFNQPIRVTVSDDVNLRLHGVNSYYDDNNINRTGWLKDINENGTYTVVGEDSAKNRLEIKIVINTEYAFVNNASELKDALTNKDVVYLTNNIELTDETFLIANGKDVTINLNGHTIEGKSTKAEASKLIEVLNGSKLTLKGNGTISFTAGKPDTNWSSTTTPPFPGYANNTIVNRGTLVIDGPTIKNNTANGGASYVVDNYSGASLTVISGTLTQVGGDTAIRLFATSATATNEVIINGGTITGKRAIWIQLAGSNSAVAPKVNVVVNGGVLDSSETTYHMSLYSYSYGNSFANTNVTINNGTFKGVIAFGAGYYADQETVVINGGTFVEGIGRYTSTGWVDIIN